MSLHNGIDTMAVASIGIYTGNYGASDPGNIANLFSSLGLLEDAPNYIAPVSAGRKSSFLVSFYKLRDVFRVR